MLLNYLIYFHDLDNFATLDRINHGDLRATIARIIDLARGRPGRSLLCDLAGDADRAYWFHRVGFVAILRIAIV